MHASPYRCGSDRLLRLLRRSMQVTWWSLPQRMRQPCRETASGAFLTTSALSSGVVVVVPSGCGATSSCQFTCSTQFLKSRELVAGGSDSRRGGSSPCGRDDHCSHSRIQRGVGGCAQLAVDYADCPFAPALIARLNYLSSTGLASLTAEALVRNAARSGGRRLPERERRPR